MDRIGRFVEPRRVFEVGVGSGWFLIRCAQRGLEVSGIEHNPVLIAHAQTLARGHGIELPIIEGSIEDTDIGEDYDVIFASSVFEHVRNYRAGLDRCYRALRPGGILYFYSTNKFALRSGEYPQLPLYGWLPNRARYRLRAARQGEQVIQSGAVDFNQFTYWGLRREFRRIGFSQVLDRFQLISPNSTLKRALLAIGPLRPLLRTFDYGTSFVCVK
jgi:SAM-dependent methyltransferase